MNLFSWQSNLERERKAFDLTLITFIYQQLMGKKKPQSKAIYELWREEMTEGKGLYLCAYVWVVCSGRGS